MDVRCERCGAEYGLDEARITEAGVSVKCSGCGNVFMVRRKAVVVTESLPATQWRVRQANGNLITFRELTTLQKWIVERKLSRKDEISLVGENWKRLGSIGELSSFFQVVDEAQRATLLEQPIRELDSATASNSSLPPRFETAGMAGLQPGAAEPAFTQGRPSIGSRPDSIESIAGALKGGPSKGLFVVLLLALLGGVSYLAYRYFVWVPQRQRQEQLEASHRSSAAPPPREDPKPDQLASQAALLPKVPAPARDGESAPAKADEAEPAKLSAEAAPSKPTETPAAAEAPAPKKNSATQAVDATAPTGVGEVGANFDSYMDKADRFREREQPRAALQAYRRAHELEPARPEPLAGRGLALLDLGQTAPAMAAFEQALKIDPRHGLALMGLAEAYRAEGEKEQAMRYYEKYLAVVPDGPEAQVARAAIKALQE